MPRACTICQHPERAAIDEALRTESFRRVAVRFGTSPSAAFRHKTSCVDASGGSVDAVPKQQAPPKRHPPRSPQPRPPDRGAAPGQRGKRPPSKRAPRTDGERETALVEAAAAWPRKGGGGRGQLIAHEPAVVAEVVLQNRILELRLRGLSCRAIGERLALPEGTTSELLKAALAKASADGAMLAQQVIDLELERCDALQSAFWRTAMRPPQTKRGRNYQAQEKAAKVIIAVMERRAKLRGLDAPEQKKLEHTGAGGAPLTAPPALQMFYQRAEAGDERAIAALEAYATTGLLPAIDAGREVVEGTADPEPAEEPPVP